VKLVIARSVSDEEIQGPLALNAGLLRSARNDAFSHHYREQKQMPRKKRARRFRSLTRADEDTQRKAAFAAIKRLYRDVLPLWNVCDRGFCRRHHRCIADARGCLPRNWPRLSPQMQDDAYSQVVAGGPRRLPPQSRIEEELRRFPPTNFVLK
jgi:hypothetical protein